MTSRWSGCRWPGRHEAVWLSGPIRLWGKPSVVVCQIVDKFHPIQHGGGSNNYDYILQVTSTYLNLFFLTGVFSAEQYFVWNCNYILIWVTCRILRPPEREAGRIMMIISNVSFLLLSPVPYYMPRPFHSTTLPHLPVRSFFLLFSSFQTHLLLSSL